ncbi:MAG TPA: trehalose-6-phosphate synthase, partial [Candidatus Angelobacter sp.]
MRLSFRLIFALVVVLTLVSVLFSYFQFRAQKRGLQQDLQRRAQILGESLQESIEPVLEKHAYRNLQHLVERFGNREHLAGIAIYDQHETPIAITPGLSNRFLPASFAPSKIDGNSTGEFRWINSSYVEIYAVALNVDHNFAGTLVVVHDADYINVQSASFWYRTFLRTTVEILLIAITTLLIIRWSLEGPITRTVQWMRALRTGKASVGRDAPEHDLFTPLKQEVTTLVESLAAARESAELEARLREAAESTWTPERLSVHVRSKLNSSRLFVVSNREPYMHSREGKTLKLQIPASGLVTALEPILRACDGTWVAHGSGDGDREAVDRHNHLAVPPDDPKYTLRRVWLSKDEEDGYYYGFANEGLWPLCHIAHTRPTFRVSDWEYYQEVNQKFAQAVLEEMRDTQRPVLLVQDYHFALLPKLIKQVRPDARVA